MRRTLFLIASVVVSALFLWLALRDVPFEDVLVSLQQANVAWILIALLFGTIGLWTRGLRWRGLLNDRITPMGSFNMLCIAMLLNQLPLRAGEVARSALATRSGVPFFTAATSILVERLLDTLLVVILLAVSLT
ncbi:MAG: flippase-like domain-containing protein, partial [Anaerolineae bacterium]|nr:flippase-like domain-containing protein [Anaerolineae bacterium]